MHSAVDSLEQNQSIHTTGAECETVSHPTLLPKVLERWHLLSLDAPTVAALWSWFFARAMHIDLPWHAPILLALGTWLVYVADRILDGTRTTPSSTLRERHYFHIRHRNQFLIAGAVVGCALLYLILVRMSANARFEDTVLFAAALLYLILVHKPRLGGTAWLPKELAVGIVFAAATAVPAWSRLAVGHAILFPAVAIFAAVCWLNCIAIERWENLPADYAFSLNCTHRSSLWIARHFALTAMALSVIAAIAGFWLSFGPTSVHPNPAPIYLAVSSAALLLVLIDRRRIKHPELHLRIAADLALLTPLLFLFFLN